MRVAGTRESFRNDQISVQVYPDSTIHAIVRESRLVRVLGNFRQQNTVRERTTPRPQVLANTLAELENPSDGYLQRHSWLAGELCGETFCFKAANTPANVGPGSYCSPDSNAAEHARHYRSHNYLVRVLGIVSTT